VDKNDKIVTLCYRNMLDYDNFPGLKLFYWEILEWCEEQKIQCKYIRFYTSPQDNHVWQTWEIPDKMDQLRFILYWLPKC